MSARSLSVLKKALDKHPIDATLAHVNIAGFVILFPVTLDDKLNNMRPYCLLSLRIITLFLNLFGQYKEPFHIEGHANEIPFVCH